MHIMGMAAPFDQMAEIFPAAPAVNVQWITASAPAIRPFRPRERTERSFLVQRKAANASGR
jgi:hypothetical protein